MKFYVKASVDVLKELESYTRGLYEQIERVADASPDWEDYIGSFADLQSNGEYYLRELVRVGKDLLAVDEEIWESDDLLGAREEIEFYVRVLGKVVRAI